jgi:hypothetical protein
VSLGAANPLPSTWRGTIANPALVTATLLTNLRREISAIFLSPLVLTANSLDDNDYTPKFKEQSCDFLCSLSRRWFWRAGR